jgi:hypothetical protein
MTYAYHRDLLRILRATLSLLKAAEYPHKGTPQTKKVANCFRETILELEISIRTTNDGQRSRISHISTLLKGPTVEARVVQ